MKTYDRVRAEVDLDAFAHNIMSIKKNIGARVSLMAIVKADGYGHGSYELSVTALQSGADILGVAVIEEAVYLRERGINAPLVIVGAGFEASNKYVVKYDIEQTVFSYESAVSLDKEAKVAGKKAKILIKIDTGMGRIGFLPEQSSINEIVKIFKLENVTVTGIFSHLSCSDHENKNYSIMQNERFEYVIGELKNNGITIPPLHISNSGAIIDLPDLRYDIVRAGIMQYGYYPSPFVNKDVFKIVPVMSLKAGLTMVKILKKGECLGYNATYTAKKDTVVATIPVGYADGYPRNLSNKGKVIINNEYAPVIGNVCMDQFMVDVTDIKDVKVGDTAILFGRSGDKEFTAEDIANIGGTISHEILCGIGKRVPRVYLKNGVKVEMQ